MSWMYIALACAFAAGFCGLVAWHYKAFHGGGGKSQAAESDHKSDEEEQRMDPIPTMPGNSKRVAPQEATQEAAATAATTSVLPINEIAVPKSNSHEQEQEQDQEIRSSPPSKEEPQQQPQEVFKTPLFEPKQGEILVNTV